MRIFTTKRKTIIISRMNSWGLQFIRAGRVKPYTWSMDIGPLHVLISARSINAKNPPATQG